MSTEVELMFSSGDRDLAGSLSAPGGSIVGGLIPLHPADGPSRSHFLLEHLAVTLPPKGIAVLRFDRRSAIDGLDVPLATQAEDGRAAAEELRRRVGNPHLPVGFWGFSQGAWAATLAATASDTAFLVLVSGSGVSPAEQMRFGTAEQLRRAGYGPEELRRLTALRAGFEGYMRGDAASEAEEQIRLAAAEPWFELAWIPNELPPPGSWTDMDFDPMSVAGHVHCPVLAFFGESDDWVPADESVERLRAAAEESGSPLTIMRLAETGHHPTLGDRRDFSAISPQYETALCEWLIKQLTG